MTVDFPFARALVVVRNERTVKKSGRTTAEPHYYLSSAGHDQFAPAQWQSFIRGHWGGVEIRNHWRRDAVWGEDRSRSRHANLLGNLALIRNALLALLPDHFQDQSLPAVRESLQSKPGRCLQVISA